MSTEIGKYRIWRLEYGLSIEEAYMEYGAGWVHTLTYNSNYSAIHNVVLF